tara:strand:+ start:136 stop:1419 length:1284 start_codon:yes stop_codon:yes gene_type:complete
MKIIKKEKERICIIGLGYVGLPLAVEFGKKYETIGYDINKKRINSLNKFFDETLEIKKNEIKKSKYLNFTSNKKDLDDNDIFIITVPTPIKKNKKPDLSLLINATKLVAEYLRKKNIVIYESTVYPGVTEEICVPILEKLSHLNYNKDFYCGYSPERINPGDKNHKLVSIKKVTSGSTEKTATKVDNLYKSIISAGTFKAKSIKVAEAAKVIENTQRDINIALINDLAMLFDKLEIDTHDVLSAANTKWNFLPFKPGLVGGHCIGVDPYYLTYKSLEVGHKPSLILAGRNTNNSIPKYILRKIDRIRIKKNIVSHKLKVLILGLTFKENCPDIRNSLVFNIIDLFKDKNYFVDVLDPYIKKKSIKKQSKFQIIEKPKKNNYDVLLLTVGHDEFKNYSESYLLSLMKKRSIIFDVKGILPNHIVDGRL